MRMKRVVSILAAAVLVFGLTGCNAITIDGETENASGEMSGNGSIGFSVSTLNNPFFVTLSEGAKEKAKTEGEKLIVVDAGDDAAKQTSDIEDLISKNISVLIVNPVDSDAVAPAVKDAVSRGIKVISVDRGVNGVDVDCAIASDNVEGAKMATEYMVSLLGENAKVAELEGVSGASATIERGKGFHLVADEKLDVVSKQTANFNRSEGMSVMENALCQPFDFIFLDEPISHLDEENGRIMSRILVEEADRQGAGIIVTSIGKHLELNYTKTLKL
mgnify:CR=1 FL=1